MFHKRLQFGLIHVVVAMTLVLIISIGDWGFSNALSRLAGSLLGGILRDGVTQAAGLALSGYLVVFGIETAMLAVAAVMLARIHVFAFKEQATESSFVEKVGLVVER